MSNDNDLLKQLQELPNEAQAPDRWQHIQQCIENGNVESEGVERDSTAESVDTNQQSRFRWGLAVAACALFIAAVSPLYFSENTVSVDKLVAQAETHELQHARTPNTYQLTIESLQQANAAYYAKLGHLVYENESAVSPKALASLNSLRQAQQQYRHALAEKPQSGRLQQRLFWLYQKERQLLRQIVV